MNVSIDAGGRVVRIECDGANTSYREVADKALEVWNATATPDGRQQMGFGLVDAGRAAAAPGRYLGEGLPRPVTA